MWKRNARAYVLRLYSEPVQINDIPSVKSYISTGTLSSHGFVPTLHRLNSDTFHFLKQTDGFWFYFLDINLCKTKEHSPFAWLLPVLSYFTTKRNSKLFCHLFFANQQPDLRLKQPGGIEKQFLLKVWQNRPAESLYWSLQAKTCFQNRN